MDIDNLAEMETLLRIYTKIADRIFEPKKT